MVRGDLATCGIVQLKLTYICSIRWILKSLGDDLTEEDIDAMIADVDTDGSGFVDYDGTW